MELRPYQHRAITRVVGEFAAGRTRVLIHAPTGAGKTVIFAALAAQFHAEGKRVLVVAHRKELIEQAAAKIIGAGIEHVGVYRGARQSRDLVGATCVVASIQARGIVDLSADLVIVDEAHHTPAPTYRRLLDLFPAACHVGATATPWWGKGNGLGGYFQTIVTAATVRELTELGHLSRVRMFTHPHTLRDLDLRGIKTSGGDYEQRAAEARVDRPSLLGDIVAHWQSHANGARTLCFAAGIEHSRHIVERFRAVGIAAEHIDGTTLPDDRSAILARLRSGETRVVSNFNVLVEGFDEPSVGCIILARPTQRAQVYLQAIGRGLRVIGEKPAVVALDHAGCCLAHGFHDDERLVSLEESGAEQRIGIAPIRRCPACGLMVHAAVRECPDCAAVLRVNRTTEEISGVLIESIRASSVVGSPKLYHHDGLSLTADQWANRLGISYWAFYGRVRRNLPDEQLFASKNPKSAGVTFNGKTQSRTAWAKELGASRELVRRRLADGWPIERALTEPPPDRTYVTVNGERRLLSDVAKDVGISVKTLRLRLRAGWKPDAITAPIVGKQEALDRARFRRASKGVEYRGRRWTLRELAAELGINRKTIAKRLKDGMTCEEIAASIIAKGKT
jgi:DNA repair protein RadD